MNSFTAVDLSKLPAPDFVETLEFEQILAEMVADLQGRDPTYIDIVESDPAYKQLEVAAYREVVIRQKINDSGRAVLLGSALKADLDQVAGNLNTERLSGEADDLFRARAQLAFEALSTAGSEGSYQYHTLSADQDVKDAKPVLSQPGQITVTVLSGTGDGTAAQPLLDTVSAALSDIDVRPLGDEVIVQSATIINYSVTATLEYIDGVVPENILQDANDAVQDYVNQQHRIGAEVALSGIYAALHRPGISKVNLTAPVASITPSANEAPYCTNIDVTAA